MSEKEQYEQKLEGRLEEMRAKIDALEARAKQADAEARLRAEGRIGELREKQRELKEKLKKLQDSGGEAWGDIRGGLDAAWKSLEASFKAAASRFD